MVTMAQMRGCRELEHEGLRPLQVPRTIQSPIPGALLFMSLDHGRLEQLMPDGRAVDLFALYDAVQQVMLGKPGSVDDLRKAFEGRMVANEGQSHG